MAVIGRPREFDRDRALDEAMQLFWRKGFAATSMSELCDAMGYRASSLFAAVGDKEALYLEAVERYVELIGRDLWGRLSEGITARDGVEKFLLATGDSLPVSNGKPGGCMAALAAVGEDCPGEIPEKMRQLRAECLNHLRSRLSAGMAAGVFLPA